GGLGGVGGGEVGWLPADIVGPRDGLLALWLGGEKARCSASGGRQARYRACLAGATTRARNSPRLVSCGLSSLSTGLSAAYQTDRARCFSPLDRRRRRGGIRALRRAGRADPGAGLAGARTKGRFPRPRDGL